MFTYSHYDWALQAFPVDLDFTFSEVWFSGSFYFLFSPISYFSLLNTISNDHSHTFTFSPSRFQITLS